MRHHRNKGFTLIGMIAFTGFFLSFTLITLGLVDSARARLDSDKQRQQAIVLAVSGLDYAQQKVAHGVWRAPYHFHAPDIDGGTFEVWLETRGTATVLKSSGRFGRETQTVERMLP